MGFLIDLKIILNISNLCWFIWRLQARHRSAEVYRIRTQSLWMKMAGTMGPSDGKRMLG